MGWTKGKKRPPRTAHTLHPAVAHGTDAPRETNSLSIEE